MLEKQLDSHPKAAMHPIDPMSPFGHFGSSYDATNIVREDNFQPTFRQNDLTEPEHLEEYGRFQQHLGLIEDQERLKAFLGAITDAPIGEVVVDVGSGTGLLALVALKCGFGHAVLIEPSRKMCAYARHLAQINGVLDRVTIVERTLETVPENVLPSQIDLIVTETLSSLIFGFGSWDALPNLISRLSHQGTIIPVSGKLHAALATKDYATRGSGKAGLGLLQRAGIQIDLFERTFRSGGNVYDKSTVQSDLESGLLRPSLIASFDFRKSIPIRLEMTDLAAPVEACGGLVLYWDVALSVNGSRTRISSLDPGLTSWYPFYVPFRDPIFVRSREGLPIKMELHKIDAPYPYAFQFVSNGIELTNVLYW